MFICILLNLYLILKQITNQFVRTYIISEFGCVLVNDTIKCDRNKYLLGFESKVYDLQRHKLREYQPEDYILMSTGYEINRNNRDKQKTTYFKLF